MHKKELRFLFSIVLLICGHYCAYSQADSLGQKPDSTADGRSYLIQKVERNGVTMPEIEIKDVTVVGRPGPDSKKSDLRKYDKLVYNIKKVYPYAVIVREKMAQVNNDLAAIKTDRGRKEYLKNVEKEVFKQYEDDISHLTINQGKMLIKLIDRETMNTSYNLIRDYRGKFSAAFWQGIARIFGTNLKEEYDPDGEDALIELIINDIDAGNL